MFNNFVTTLSDLRKRTAFKYTTLGLGITLP